MGILVPDEGRVGLLCMTRGLGFGLVRAGEPGTDFERPVVPSKIVLYTQQITVRGRGSLGLIGGSSRGVFNSACAGSLGFLRESG